DAFVLRTLLVPALMHLLGRANWWLPRRLDRVLPRISIEPPECRAAHERLGDVTPDMAGLANMAELVKEQEPDVRDIPG
ncbi:MMPL family transporter, partial [Streptomyces sp. SID625]|nr:MMPL family transporter [Streptomyces sp. SID625]